MRPSLIVSVHDVAPSTSWAARWWAGQLESRGVPATYLVVPGPWEGPTFRADRDLAAWLRDRDAAGDEIAQHGWTHHAGDEGTRLRRAIGSLAARGCGEFWTLDEDEARRRLELGLAALRAAGLEPVGFTPPGWLASLGTVRALRALGYRYTTSHLGVTDLETGRRYRVPPLSHRPGSPVETLAAAAVRAAARHAARRRQSVRVAIHPRDLARSRLAEVTLDAIDTLLSAGARPRTYLDFVASHAREGAGVRRVA
jgi:predicted deacetylase